MHAPDWLKSIKGEYDHISKCWTLMSKGRSRCPSILYCVNAYINSIILIVQCLPLYSVLQLDSVFRTGLHISKGELQSLLPYLIYLFYFQSCYIYINYLSLLMYFYFPHYLVNCMLKSLVFFSIGLVFLFFKRIQTIANLFRLI
uniref:Uncharacterized protein n=1 Tax=Hyaloperonospora arabidopsidis (strain Emoy2) TaxID=559515 RepID=M4BWL4_HYAAE